MFIAAQFFDELRRMRTDLERQGEEEDAQVEQLSNAARVMYHKDVASLRRFYPHVTGESAEVTTPSSSANHSKTNATAERSSTARKPPAEGETRDSGKCRDHRQACIHYLNVPLCRCTWSNASPDFWSCRRGARLGCRLGIVALYRRTYESTCCSIAAA